MLVAGRSFPSAMVPTDAVMLQKWHSSQSPIRKRILSPAVFGPRKSAADGQYGHFAFTKALQTAFLTFGATLWFSSLDALRQT
jgi:hypothetical protein